MNRKQRESNRNNDRTLAVRFGVRYTCSNCGKKYRQGGHYVPPSLGEPGFWACAHFKDGE